jgi:hypothetical protein
MTIPVAVGPKRMLALAPITTSMAYSSARSALNRVIIVYPHNSPSPRVNPDSTEKSDTIQSHNIRLFMSHNITLQELESYL